MNSVQLELMLIQRMYTASAVTPYFGLLGLVFSYHTCFFVVKEIISLDYGLGMGMSYCHDVQPIDILIHSDF